MTVAPPAVDGSRAERRAVTVSLSRIAGDPRLRRQIAALTEAGWRVTSAGFGEAGQPATGWTHVTVPDVGFDARIPQRAARIAGLLGVRLHAGIAQEVWARQERHRALVAALRAVDGADLVIANDYVTVPACLALARRLGAGLLYDMHEYSAGECAEDPRWRLLYPPYVRAIERSAIEAGATLTTVSDGIAAQVAADYGLGSSPGVVRNLPPYVAVAARPTGETHLVHHHGALVPGRGLEALLRSVPLWEPRFSLRIRGPGPEAYVGSLKALIGELGIAGRVTMEGAAPVEQLIPLAADADIGIHMLPGFSHQNAYALPNKLFEYLMAGLAVVFTDLPEMARIIRGHGVGVLVGEETPEAIAAAINGLTRGQIARCRAAALESARILSWDQERERFLAYCETAAARPLARAA